jgi:hypothetical protein
LRSTQAIFSSAVTFAEEAYNLVVVAYDCVHPKVQEAAGQLIENLYDAERFAQLTYSNLMDFKNGMNQECKAVAFGTHNLADVKHQLKEDHIKAEEL